MSERTQYDANNSVDALERWVPTSSLSLEIAQRRIGPHRPHLADVNGNFTKYPV
jgi:hypothetical protein